MQMQINVAFEKYYFSIYGERWQKLGECLQRPAVSVQFNVNLKKPYMLDYASVLAAMSLRLPENGLILDACAAPGGKSIIIASRMGENNILISNELSSDRRRILKKNLDEHLNEKIITQIKITGIDAAKLGSKKDELEKYDAILLDVPCSSERHVIRDEKALAKWTPARPRFLSNRQWSLLSAAFLMLKQSGSLVYSTCAINPEENDDVIDRLFKKYGDKIIPDKPDFNEGEETKSGRIILPDTCNGTGPMYVARFKKSG